MSKHFLTLMLVFKNEAIYLKEWLDYHIIMGVQHFYLYDNDSDDDPLSVLKWYIDNGIITYYTLPGQLGFNSLSWPHRNLNIDRHGESATWMLFTDADEFLCIRDDECNNTHSVLSKYSEYSGVAIRSINYGSNGLVKYSDELVIKRFFKRAELPASFKSIVRPLDVNGCITGHCFSISSKAKYPYTISVGRKKINPSDISWVKNRGHISNDEIYINHYRYKSEEEFLKFKNKNPQLSMDSKMYSEGRFIDGNKTDNAVVARKIQFLIPYLHDDFVRVNFDKIVKFYMSPDIKDLSIRKFLVGL